MDKSEVTNTLKFQDNVGLVHFQTKFGMKWANKCGANLDYDDLFQEASVAFCVAANGFNPESGVKFSAYYSQVAFSHFRNAISKALGTARNLTDKQRAQVKARREENELLRASGKPTLPDMFYGIATTSFGEMNSAFEDGEGFEQNVASDAETPEEIVEFRQEVEFALGKLSPLARMMVEWLKEPPPELVEEVKKCHAYAEATNTNAILEDETSLKTVAKFLQMVTGVSGREVANIKREIMGILNTIEGNGNGQRKYA